MKQVAGTHYQQAVQPITLIDKLDFNFAEGSVVKYISRYKKKNGKEDLNKAIDYLDHLIKNHSKRLPIYPDLVEVDWYCDANGYDKVVRSILYNLYEKDYIVAKKLTEGLVFKEYGN